MQLLIEILLLRIDATMPFEADKINLHHDLGPQKLQSKLPDASKVPASIAAHLNSAGQSFDERQRHGNYRVAGDAEGEDVAQHRGPVRRSLRVAFQMETLVFGVVWKRQRATDCGSIGGEKHRRVLRIKIGTASLWGIQMEALVFGVVERRQRAANCGRIIRKTSTQKSCGWKRSSSSLWETAAGHRLRRPGGKPNGSDLGRAILEYGFQIVLSILRPHMRVWRVPYRDHSRPTIGDQLNKHAENPSFSKRYAELAQFEWGF